MTLDEAIKHCKEKAKELSDKAYAEWGYGMTEEQAYDCNECAREHEQLARWLEDYKRLLAERQEGEWTHIRCDMYECSKCKHIYTSFATNGCDANFCPNCGAKMKGEEE